MWQVPTSVGPVGLEPTTYGLKVHGAQRQTGSYGLVTCCYTVHPTPRSLQTGSATAPQLHHLGLGSAERWSVTSRCGSPHRRRRGREGGARPSPSAQVPYGVLRLWLLGICHQDRAPTPRPVAWQVERPPSTHDRECDPVIELNLPNPERQRGLQIGRQRRGVGHVRIAPVAERSCRRQRARHGGGASQVPSALSWLPSVSRRRREWGSRLGCDGSGKWLIRRAGVGL